jgi:hypothetical protein
MSRVGLLLNRSTLTAQGLLIASSGSAIWKLGRLEGFGNRFKVQAYAKRDTRRGAESEAVGTNRRCR